MGQPAAEIQRVAKLRFTNSSLSCVDRSLSISLPVFLSLPLEWDGNGETTAKRRAGSGIIAQLTRGKTRYNKKGWGGGNGTRENRPIIITGLCEAVIVPIRRTGGTRERRGGGWEEEGTSRFADNSCAREVMWAWRSSMSTATMHHRMSAARKRLSPFSPSLSLSLLFLALSSPSQDRFCSNSVALPVSTDLPPLSPPWPMVRHTGSFIIISSDGQMNPR